MKHLVLAAALLGLTGLVAAPVTVDFDGVAVKSAFAKNGADDVGPDDHGNPADDDPAGDDHGGRGNEPGDDHGGHGADDGPNHT